MSHLGQNCLFDMWESRSVVSFHTSSMWPGYREEAIQAFLNGEGAGPVATTPTNLDLAKERRAAVQRFIDHVRAMPTPPVCAPAYLEYEAERLAILDSIINAAEGQPVLRQLDLLWGRPEDMRGGDALAWLKADVAALGPQSDEVAQAQARILKLWPDITAGTQLKQVFDELEAHRLALAPIVRQRHPYIDELMADLPDGDATSEQAAAFLAAGLHRMLPPNSGWDAEVQAEAPNILNDNGRRRLVIPAGRTYSQARLEALLIHEVGVHDLRAANGNLSAERLASVGMPGYGAGEEAFGTLYGGAGKPDRNFSYDVLAFGVFDLASRPGAATFRIIHERVSDLMLCLANPSQEEIATQLPAIRRAAFSRCIRTCRMGTAVITERSISKYWRGMNIIHEYLTEHGVSPETVETFLAGKYDCRRADQLSLIRYHTLEAPSDSSQLPKI